MSALRTGRRPVRRNRPTAQGSGSSGTSGTIEAFRKAEVGGGSMAKKKKVRVDLRKNRSKPPRDRQWTRGFQEHGFAEEATAPGERVRAKGDLSRRRTIIQEETGDAQPADMPAVDAAVSIPGRVLRVHGLFSMVE